MKINGNDVGASSNLPGTTAQPSGLFEMTLEVSDLAASERFYHDVIGLPIAQRWTDERPAVWLALERGLPGTRPPRRADPPPSTAAAVAGTSTSRFAYR